MHIDSIFICLCTLV